MHKNQLNNLLIFSILSAISCPLFVSLISFVLPCLSKITRPSFSRFCNILTAWLYVQSTSFARMLPYLALVIFFKATSIKAGFLLKKISKLSFILSEGYDATYISHQYLAFKLFCSSVISHSSKSFWKARKCIFQ